MGENVNENHANLLKYSELSNDIFVRRLVTVADTGWFASSSSDSFVRLWDCSKMEGRNIANRSRQWFNVRSGSLNSMTICRNNQSLATVCSQGTVTVLK